MEHNVTRLDKCYINIAFFLTTDLLSILLAVVSGIGINIATSSGLNVFSWIAIMCCLGSCFSIFRLIVYRKMLDNNLDLQSAQKKLSADEKWTVACEIDTSKPKIFWWNISFSTILFLAVVFFVYKANVEEAGQPDIQALIHQQHDLSTQVVNLNRRAAIQQTLLEGLRDSLASFKKPGATKDSQNITVLNQRK